MPHPSWLKLSRDGWRASAGRPAYLACGILEERTATLSLPLPMHHIGCWLGQLIRSEGKTANDMSFLIKTLCVNA